MKHLLLTLLLAVSLSATAGDSWTGPDKKLHFGFSFVLGFAAGNQWPDNKPLAIGVAMIPGVVKEASDAQKGGSGWSNKDLVWDAIGAMSGVYSAHWLVQYRDKKPMLSYRTEF